MRKKKSKLTDEVIDASETPAVEANSQSVKYRYSLHKSDSLVLLGQNQSLPALRPLALLIGAYIYDNSYKQYVSTVPLGTPPPGNSYHSPKN
jgi:hypothetical protein